MAKEVIHKRERDAITNGVGEQLLLDADALEVMAAEKREMGRALLRLAKADHRIGSGSKRAAKPKDPPPPVTHFTEVDVERMAVHLNAEKRALLIKSVLEAGTYGVDDLVGTKTK